METLIEKNTAKGKRFAVKFEKNGHAYQTLFTSFRDEAISWGRTIRATGWCMSARPLPL